jgi:hypothetical protein
MAEDNPDARTLLQLAVTDAPAARAIAQVAFEKAKAPKGSKVKNYSLKRTAEKEHAARAEQNWAECLADIDAMQAEFHKKEKQTLRDAISAAEAQASAAQEKTRAAEAFATRKTMEEATAQGMAEAASKALELALKDAKEANDKAVKEATARKAMTIAKRQAKEETAVYKVMEETTRHRQQQQGLELQWLQSQQWQQQLALALAGTWNCWCWQLLQQQQMQAAMMTPAAEEETTSEAHETPRKNSLPECQVPCRPPPPFSGSDRGETRRRLPHNDAEEKDAAENVHRDRRHGGSHGSEKQEKLYSKPRRKRSKANIAHGLKRRSNWHPVQSCQ